MNLFKQLHFYLHTRYEVVRFWVAMITAVIVLATLMGQSKKLEREFSAGQDRVKAEAIAAEQRSKDLQEAVDELKADNSRQTRLISCLLAIHGENSAISAEDAAECQSRAETELEAEPEPMPQASAPQSQSPSPTPSPAPITPENPEPPARSIPERVLDLIDSLRPFK